MIPDQSSLSGENSEVVEKMTLKNGVLCSTGGGGIGGVVGGGGGGSCGQEKPMPNGTGQTTPSELYVDSDTVDFWAERAYRLISWFKPWVKTLDTSNTP